MVTTDAPEPEGKLLYKINTWTFYFCCIITFLSYIGSVGYSQSEVNEVHESFFYPMQYWGIISYAMVFAFGLAFTIYQRKEQVRYSHTIVSTYSYWWSLNLLLQSIWCIAVGQMMMILATNLVVAQFICLSIIWRRLRVARQRCGNYITKQENLFYYIPISLYYGWVTSLLPMHITMVLSVNGYSTDVVLTSSFVSLIFLILMVYEYGRVTKPGDPIFCLSIGFTFVSVAARLIYIELKTKSAGTTVTTLEYINLIAFGYSVFVAVYATYTSSAFYKFPVEENLNGSSEVVNEMVELQLPETSVTNQKSSPKPSPKSSPKSGNSPKETVRV